jgi:sugar O-acyltransferase (sialic acid O-acetyltransferase NeuD family)
MKRLALLGASGHGKVVAEAAINSGWHSITFFDDAWPALQQNGRWSVAGNTAALLEQLAKFDGVIVSIGNCRIRWQKHQELASAGAPLTTITHPSATVSQYASVGNGSAVLAGACINIDAVIGQAGIINTGATVDHDCQLADAVHICPGAHLSGNVYVGHQSWIGVGATIKQRINIGADVMVGAGAVIVASVPDAVTVIGNPARLLRNNPDT